MIREDLRHFPLVVSEYGADDERKARFAAIASITAIVLLIVANITPAAIDRWQDTFAAPPAVSSTSHFPKQSAVAASMPAAQPIFESAHKARLMSAPLQCYGQSRHGLWIEHSGDRRRTKRRCV